jgi:hypothetical protein
MAFTKAGKLGVGVAALALVATAGIGFTPPATELPTVVVHHNPT